MTSMFIEVIAYVIIFAIFVAGFMPLMLDFVVTGQATANTANDTLTANFLTLIVPLVFVAFIIGFALRASGRKPPGEW